MDIKLIADSGADLPKEFAEEYDIKIMPIFVHKDEQEYLDGVTIQSLDVFKDMREGAVYKTAQVSIKIFKELFVEYAKKDKKCIYIAFSSGISGTYQAAVIAMREVLEEYPNFDIDVVDSKAASYGCGLIIKYIAELIKTGKSKKEVLEAFEFYSQHMEHIFTVDDLEYLYRGGRVSQTAAFVGGILNIKPILNVEDGALVPLEKIRGSKKVFKRMLDLIEERGADLSNQTIGISHADALESAEALKQQMEERFACKDFVITMIGSAIGAHSGPGTLAVFFLNKEIPNQFK